MDDRVITVVVVDDHEIVRTGIRACCEAADPPIAVVADDAGTDAAWKGSGVAADVVVLDLGLDAGLAFDDLRQLVEAGRQVVVHTQYATDASATRCTDLGALAYVTKSEGPVHLVAAIRAAAEGRSYTPPSLSGALAADDSPNRPKLTPRELDALKAWFASSSKTMAAKRLGISPKTLETFIERARVRFAYVGRPAPSKALLVQRALEDGLITMEDLQHP